MSTLTLPAPSWWQQARTIVRGLFGDDHEGATADWRPTADLPPAAVDLAAPRLALPEYADAVRVAVDAPEPEQPQVLTGECLRTVTDELGRWVPELYDLEPARLFDAVLLGTAAGEPFRTGAAA